MSALKSCDCGPTLAELLVDRSPENLTLQLSEVDSAIARLSERSRGLRERINATNPFLSLPALEIISDISVIACQPVYNANDPDNFARSTQLTTPLMLGKICRTWRHIAWDSPRLWNVIFLGLRREPKIYEAQVEVLEAWLSRSGDLLLSIHLSELEDDPEGWSESPPTEVFNLLASHSHRWLHIRTFLVGPCWEDLEELPLPFLTSLSVEPPGHVFSDIGYVTPTWRISDAPFLRTVYITLFDGEIKLPAHQLTQITLQSQHWKSCLLLLADTPKVVYCALRDFMAYIIETNYQAVISLPRMSSFSVGSSHAEFGALMNILNCITAPALYRMQLEWTGVSSSEPLATVRAFLFRSSCSLRELSLHIGVDTEQSELVALFGDTESLEILELTIEVGQGLIDPVLNHLNPARPQDIPQYLPPAQVLLPNLRCFRYKGPMRFKIKTLVDMIDMRYRLAYDSEKFLELGGEENHSRIARPEAFSINISQINRDQRTSLSVSAGTLQRLINEHDGITFSFLDQADNNIPLLSWKSLTDLTPNVVNPFSMFEGFRG